MSASASKVVGLDGKPRRPQPRRSVDMGAALRRTVGHAWNWSIVVLGIASLIVFWLSVIALLYHGTKGAVEDLTAALLIALLFKATLTVRGWFAPQREVHHFHVLHEERYGHESR